MQSWCDVLENSELGNAMKAKGFWEKVINNFEKVTGSNRTYNSIISKWNIGFAPRVGAFCTIFNNMQKTRASGENDLHVYQKACAKYQVMHGHPFQLEHCWEVLRDHVAWKQVEMPHFQKPDNG